ncbi:outer membrane protein assembly factor BamB family protein [Gilvimarinus sp. F26214L]|uniref:outer membrane protein assembly factor BamB family protein n=1 Tax=Gilvimarinus sp. DZF01 TaxID=3461371 RepID=UPI00404564AA
MKKGITILASVAIWFAGPAQAQDADTALQDAMKKGEPFYKERCALCHDNPEDYVPPRRQLELRSADYVINALTKGSMYPHAKGLDEAEVRSIAIYVTGKMPTGSTLNPDWKLNACAEPAAPIAAGDLHWNGWGRDLNNSRYHPEPGFSPKDIKNLKVKWSFAYPNGRHNSQPTIAGDQVFVAAAPGRVYSLDVGTGCSHWVYDPDAGVRATVSVGPIPGTDQQAVFVGTTDRFVHAIDTRTGERLWKTQVGELEEARVTGAPILHEDTLYVPLSSFEETAAVNPDYECCRFRGNVVALDTKTGAIKWRTYVIDEEPQQHKTNKLGKPMFGPAGAAIWSAPTIDLERSVLYVATGDSYTDVPEDGSDAIVAMDLKTGEVKWKNQVLEGDNFLVGCFGRGGHANCPEEVGPDYDFGSSVILRKAGDTTLALAGQKSGIMYAMDVNNKGKIVWERKVGHGSALGGIQWGSAADEKAVYVPVTDTAVFQPDLRKPGLTALDIATGETLWHTPAPKAQCGDGGRCGNGLSAAISAMPGAVFAGSLDGMLRAYSTSDGSILWEFDTKQSYQTVNGLEVKGGSINATGPTMAKGMLFMNSGYGGIMNAGSMGGSAGAAKGQDGNVLLVFSVDGR